MSHFVLRAGPFAATPPPPRPTLTPRIPPILRAAWRWHSPRSAPSRRPRPLARGGYTMSLACLQNKHTRPSEAPELQERRQSAWDVLYLTHRPAVYGRCRRLLGDPHAAEDAAQETFARSFVHLQGIGGAEHQRRWLLRVATNYCLNQLRDRKRQTELLLQLDASRMEDSAAALAARDVAVCATRALRTKFGEWPGSSTSTTCGSTRSRRRSGSPGAP